jgi:hypothetical protein
MQPSRAGSLVQGLSDASIFNEKRYDIPALSDPAGRYGRWNLRGIGVYVVGVLIQLPFVDTHFYAGPMVAQLGGVDISWIVGMLVPGILYFLLARTSAWGVPVDQNSQALIGFNRSNVYTWQSFPFETESAGAGLLAMALATTPSPASRLLQTRYFVEGAAVHGCSRTVLPIPVPVGDRPCQ